MLGKSGQEGGAESSVKDESCTIVFSALSERRSNERKLFVQKIATIFPGLFKDQIEFSRPSKCTFPVQANRFLRLQVFAPCISLTTFLSFLVISCFYTRILQCLKLLYTGKEYYSIVYAKQFGFDATTFKVEENSRTFEEVPLKFKDFSRSPSKIQGLFKTMRTLVHEARSATSNSVL